MEINPEFLRVAKASVGVPEGKAEVHKEEEKNLATQMAASHEKVAAKAVVDAVFMMDCTGSMGSFLAKAKQTIKKMITDIKDHYTESSIFIAFIAYYDHCDSKVLDYRDLTGDVEEIYRFIDSLTARGGDDTAEAVADALDCAAHKITWRQEDALRLLIHICDAPPHGREFECSSDSYPDGCPCKIDYKVCLKRLSELKTQYLILNFTSYVDKMVEVFKQFHDDIENLRIAQEPAGPHLPEDTVSCPPHFSRFLPRRPSPCAWLKSL